MSIEQLVFPAILDTGHSHNFSITSRQLREWAGVESLEEVGQIEVNRGMMPQYEARIQLHRNRPGTSELTPASYPLIMDQGITVIPEGTEGGSRLPLLGLRALTRNGLELLVDERRRRVRIRRAGGVLIRGT